MITPQQIADTAQSIVGFWEESELPDTDKTKILEMVKDYYEGKNEHIHEQYLAALCQRTIDRRVPKTKFDDVG